MMMRGHALALLVLTAFAWACDGGPRQQTEHDDADRQRPPRTTVLWISVDGLRPDYLDRGDTPFLDRLAGSGLYTRQLVPVFPSLTFPSHVSQATGVKPAEHGIVANAFFDRRSGRRHHYPGDAGLLEAEPIWLTAARQNVRTLVYDWTLSHSQQGEVTAAYFDNAFDPGLSDADHLERVLATWRNDEGEAPLRLLMSWIGDPDRAGHRHGPDSPEVIETVEKTDALLERIHEQALDIYRQTHREGDSFYLLLTTDHGMSTVHTVANLQQLAAIEQRDGVELITSGNIGHIHFTESRGAEHESRIADAARVADGHDFARAWRREQLPQAWNYAHPKRTGDVVVVLETGFTFSRRVDNATAPVEQAGGPLGMHGYDPREDPNMNGFGVIWRYPEPLGGREIERIHALQLHATVANILDIAPAEGAHDEAVELDAATHSVPETVP